MSDDRITIDIEGEAALKIRAMSEERKTSIQTLATQAFSLLELATSDDFVMFARPKSPHGLSRMIVLPRDEQHA